MMIEWYCIALKVYSLMSELLCEIEQAQWAETQMTHFKVAFNEIF